MMSAPQISLAETLAHIGEMAAARASPILATPEQIYAERLTLEVLGQPAVKSAQAAILAQLRDHPNSQSIDGAATLERTVLLWTTTFIMQKISEQISPAFLIYADDTPHTWFGHEFPGAGVSGDNPDNIYRVAEIDGARFYHVEGLMPASPPAQITINLARAMSGGGNANATTSDLGNNMVLFKDEDLEIGPDGRFRISIGPADGPSNHMRSEPGKLELWVRESKSDWRQPAVKLSIHDGEFQDRPPPTVAAIAAETAKGLEDWCIRWATFRMNYLGRPPINTVNPPVARDGAWGILAGGRWELDDDEAIILVVDPLRSRYLGVMLTDPWAIAFDARNTISARNNSQTTFDADGLATYVISARDPGVKNWISTSGFTQGEMRIRWQRFPGSFESAKSIRRYSKVTFADVARELPSHVGMISPDARRAELSGRARDYETRWTG